MAFDTEKNILWPQDRSSSAVRVGAKLGVSVNGVGAVSCCFVSASSAASLSSYATGSSSGGGAGFEGRSCWFHVTTLGIRWMDFVSTGATALESCARAVCGEAAVVLITSTDAAASSLLRDADGAVGAAFADAVTLVSLSSRSKDMATAMGACFARPCDHSWL